MKFDIVVASFLLGLCGFCLSETVEESCPRIDTPLGTIEGYYKNSYGGRRYEAYEGIPYAQPPVGDLRFQVPQKVSPWTGVLEAKEFGMSCLQYDTTIRAPAYKVSGSEDCLYLNVYKPVARNSDSEENGNSTDLLPVIFYIHGGGFIFGASSLYGPQYLLDRDVVVVIITYRVGALGFLSTEDDVVPGNMGLKDQVVALRWVHDNIEPFGGDPSKITIFGQSAGGASVHYHYLTNLTQGLFQGGMSISGTALTCWSLVKNPLEKAKKLATVVGCPTTDTKSMIDCMRSRPAHQIVDGLREFTEWVYHISNGWGPTVEKAGGEFTFIDREPVDIILSGDAQQLPWITGVTSNESLYPLSYYVADEELFGGLDDNWNNLASYILFYKDAIPKSNYIEVAKLIKQHYLGDSSISRSTLNQTVQLLSDRLYTYPAQLAARYHAYANLSPVYFYYFTYRGAHSYTEVMSGTTERLGVAHGDDLSYTVDALFDPTTTSEDREMHDKMLDLWVSFATNGAPDVCVEWLPLNRSLTDELQYLHIAGPTELHMERASNFGQKNFWSSINFRENIVSWEYFGRNV